MADIVSPEVRSKMMSLVRTRGTTAELVLRRALYARGHRYRVNVRKLPGSPDIVFAKYRAAIFVHGCFWHRHHGCGRTTTPATRTEFWQAKFEANVKRDRRNVADLRAAGWRVGVVWECAVGKVPSSDLIDRIEVFLKSHTEYVELP